MLWNDKQNFEHTWIRSEGGSFKHSNGQSPIKLYMIQFVFKFYHMVYEKYIIGTQKDKNYEINAIL
jgi:hypothetical protein